MSAWVYVGVLIVALRVIGALLRASQADLPARFIGWLFCALAGWLASGAAGAMWPMWLVAPIAIAGTLFATGRYRRAGWLAGDAIIVLMCGLLAIPALDAARLAAAAAAFVGLGLMADFAAGRIRAHRWVAAGAVAACTALTIGATWTGRGTARLLLTAVPAGMILPNTVPDAERVALRTGGIAWYDRPRSSPPIAAALLLHGGNEMGSNQPTAIVLRRALVDAGVAVLALDHPGHGETPVPAVDAPVEAWDPLPNALAALTWLRQTSGAVRVIAVGHSLGATDVLRLLASGAKVNGAMLFGAGLRGPSDHDDYWYGRFHTDRRMTKTISRETWREIRDRYYDPSVFQAHLPGDHPPIRFVKFDKEHDNVVATRDAYYDALSAPKSMWEFESDHYFNTNAHAGLIIADMTVAFDLQAGFAQFVDSLSDQNLR